MVEARPPETLRYRPLEDYLARRKFEARVYRILLEHAAEKNLSRLPTDAHDRVIAAIQGLARDPRPPGCLILTGAENDWRIRAGDYRVIYAINPLMPPKSSPVMKY